MIKILMIQPWAVGDRSYRSKLSALISYAPLTLPTLYALIPSDLECTAKIYDEINGPVSYDEDYDIVAITVQISCAPRAYEIAENFRRRGAHIVLGGYHPTNLPEEALLHADTVIVGAAEYAWPRFLRDYAEGAPQRLYDLQNVCGEDIKAPDRSVVQKHKYLRYPALVANRGCPNHCEFCAISKMWRHCGARPIPDVIAEVKSLKSKMVVFFDPNFFGAREYSIALMKELAKLKIRWAGSATIGSAFDTELMELARESGCAGLLVGLESLNRETLRQSHKGFNDPNRYKEAIAIMQSYGISVNGCFILGMDGDTEELLLSLPDQVNYLNLNLARFSVLTPVPNSALYDRLEAEGRLFCKGWSRYNQHEAVFHPQNMTAERLNEIYRIVWKRTYSFKNLLTRVKNSPNKSIKEKLICLGANLGFKYLGME